MIFVLFCLVFFYRIVSIGARIKVSTNKRRHNGCERGCLRTQRPRGDRINTPERPSASPAWRHASLAPFRASAQKEGDRLRTSCARQLSTQTPRKKNSKTHLSSRADHRGELSAVDSMVAMEMDYSRLLSTMARVSNYSDYHWVIAVYRRLCHRCSLTTPAALVFVLSALPDCEGLD